MQANWEVLVNGGGTHAQLTLLKYWDTFQLNITKFATHFENINVSRSFKHWLLRRFHWQRNEVPSPWQLQAQTYLQGFYQYDLGEDW